MAEQAQKQQEEGQSSGEYYDEEEEEENKEDGDGEVQIPVGKKGKGNVEQEPFREQAVEMRLIVKQVQLNVTDPEKKVRVELMRNGKKISTDFKPKDENSGTFNIKQSFNQKFKERFDNESMRWIEDKVELSIYYGGDGDQNAEETLVGTCQFDITKYIDQGGKNEKAVML